MVVSQSIAPSIFQTYLKVFHTVISGAGAANVGLPAASVWLNRQACLQNPLLLNNDNCPEMIAARKSAVAWISLQTG